MAALDFELPLDDLPFPDARYQPSTPSPFHTPLLNSQDVFELTVSELQRHYKASTFTITEYTQYCIDRIFATNPYLESVIEVNPDALSIARTLEFERRQAIWQVRDLGPLHGVPVLVKDTMATADRMQTTGGSWALLGCKVPQDAFIVTRLREAGAIILGKTNLDEWAGMRGDVYSCGFTARGGQTRNPYNLTRSASGSSSGSAVTVSANIVPLAFGTETDTSIIGPALACGIVGIKPTVGLTSRSGIIPISNTQDSIGPYGRTVADAALALDIIAAPDPEDHFTNSTSRPKHPPTFTSQVTTHHSLTTAKFGLPLTRFWSLAPNPQKAVASRVLSLLTKAGATIVPVELPCATERIHPDGHWDWERYGTSNPSRSEITVSKVQTYNLMNTYLSKLTNTPIRTLEDIVTYNDANNGSESGHPNHLPAFMDGQDLFRACVATQGKEDETYHSALKWIQHQTRENGIDAALKHTFTDDHGNEQEETLDALLFCDIKMAGTNIAAQAGYPVVAVPIGLDIEGMPVGLTIQHTAWEDGRCVKWASAIEDLLKCENEKVMRGMEGKLSLSSDVAGGMTTDVQGEEEFQVGEEEMRQRMLGRVPPVYKEHLRKNVPVEYQWRYKGAPRYNVRELRRERMERGVE